jgi:hypothetical protein
MTTDHAGFGRPRRSLLVAAVLFLVESAPHAQEDKLEFHAQIDVRMVATDVERSFTDGGLGLGRFDQAHEDLQLGRAFLDFRGRLAETVDLQLTLDAYGDADKNPVDLSEVFLEWRPYPSSGWRWRTRLGAFYPPISLENRGPGWQSAYSISSSAINTWIAEEIRTIGAEVNATWLGSRLGKTVDVSLIAAAYGWNDPMGVVIFERGWAIHDRQTALFGHLPKMFAEGSGRAGLELFHEIDDRAGYYAAVQVSWPDRVVLRAMHYDNRGDPEAVNGYESAWLSRFDSAGLRVEWPNDWTLILQWMGGDTGVGPSDDGKGLIIVDYDSYFALVSRAFGAHRLTLRFDDLATDTSRGAEFFNNYQDAEAWTLAYLFDLDAHWQLAAEALQIRGELEQRGLIGLDPEFRERTLQLAVRYAF